MFRFGEILQNFQSKRQKKALNSVIQQSTQHNLFKPWPKIGRYTNNKIIISEKMDGTNGCFIIKNGEVVGCQSRNRLLSINDDNMGFAKWVDQNKNTLKIFPDGYYYGEWCGPGIQKNPHNLDEKTFFMFPTGVTKFLDPLKNLLPTSTLKFVNILYSGVYTSTIVDKTMSELAANAKRKGYKPEGVVIYSISNNVFQKATFENPEGKWKNLVDK